MEGLPTFTKEYTMIKNSFGANVGKCTMKFPHMEHLGYEIPEYRLCKFGSTVLRLDLYNYDLVFDGRSLIYENIICSI